MNTILCTASYVGEIFTESGLRFMELKIPVSGTSGSPVPLYLMPNMASGSTFDCFAPGCNLLVKGRLYPNRNDYKMYVAPTHPLQAVPKEVSVNQVNLAGGVGYIGEQKLEDLFTFSLMVKGPSQPLINYSFNDGMGFRIESWGDDAKRLVNLLYVGRQMALAGALRYNTWQAQDGSQRSTYQVRVRSSQYSVFGKSQAKAEGEPQQTQAKTQPMQYQPTPLQQQDLAPCSVEAEIDPPF